MKSRTSSKRTRRTGRPTPSAETLKADLREVGLRSTAPRLAVLEYLHRAGVPASHGELFERLASAGFDRATLYRNLIDLAEAGLLTRTDLGDHVWRFELRRDGEDHGAQHPHFVCSDCGDVSCLPGASIRISAPAGAPRALSLKSVKVQVTGLCDRCA